MLRHQRAFVGLGSNLGDRARTLASAVAALGELPAVDVIQGSRLYETAPLGPSHEEFMNAAVEVRTEVEPRALLDALLSIERTHGRVRRERWGARTLDLDLLLLLDGAGQLVLHREAGLEVPHPGLLERDFVLGPLRDLVPDLEIDGKTIAAHLDELEQRTIRTVHPVTCYLADLQAGSSAG